MMQLREHSSTRESICYHRVENIIRQDSVIENLGYEVYEIQLVDR